MSRPTVVEALVDVIPIVEERWTNRCHWSKRHAQYASGKNFSHKWPFISSNIMTGGRQRCATRFSIFYQKDLVCLESRKVVNATFLSLGKLNH